MALKVAVVGSGPSACYTVEGLLNERGGEIEIDVIERLPTPYGLVRAGVAPDHQSIKAVTRRFDGLHAREAVRFFGNLLVGQDLGIAELKELYDAVVLAVGAPQDRALGIPGESLRGVIGAARFVGWYNAHPDFAALDPCLECDAAVVIGNGNVAIDVARVLTKTPQEMAQSDLSRAVAARIHGSLLERIHIVGRRGPLDVSFTPKELGELGELSAASVSVDAAQMPAPADSRVGDPAFQRVVDTLHRYASLPQGPMPRRIHLRFFSRPVEILGDTRVRAVRFERTQRRGEAIVGTGETFDLPCGLVVSCIGYRSLGLEDVPFDDARGIFRNEDGWIAPGLYCVGWARRGPSGTIGTNRLDGFCVASQIAKTTVAAGKAGRAGLERLIEGRGLRAISFAQWKRIDAAEIAAARSGAPREKIVSIEEMLAMAGATGGVTK